MELSNSRPEVLALWHRQEDTVTPGVATIIKNAVAPPVNLDLGNLESEEDDNARDGDGARECSGGDEVVLFHG